MKIPITILTILIFVFAETAVSGQINDEHIRQLVLEKGIIDSLFVFGKWTENGQTENHLKYLGFVKTKGGQTYKIVNSIWYWGLSHRATSRILLFNEKNQYVGKYCVTSINDLPTRLENENLIFDNLVNGCDKNLKTIVNLSNGLPSSFFRKCNGRYGDIYKLEFD